VRPIYRTGTPLPSTHPIFYIFSTNTSTDFLKHAAHSPFLSLQNATFFGSCIIHILYTGCAKKNFKNSGAKRLNVTELSALWERCPDISKNMD
jgi:hypothetical protein